MSLCSLTLSAVLNLVPLQSLLFDTHNEIPTVSKKIADDAITTRLYKRMKRN